MNELMQNLKETLDSARVKYEFTKLPENIAMDVDVHMKFHGKDIKLAMANMVFKTERGFVVVQRRGDTDVDNRKLRKLLKVKGLRLATKDELSSFGLTAGMVPPLGYDLPIYMDKKVLENDEIYTGTGERLFTVKLSPRDLLKVNKATLADFTKTASTITENRVLSGIRATGRLHLGNYLGAVKGFLELANQGTYETFYMVADLHAITTPYDTKTLSSNARSVVIDYLAAGLDPEESTIFIQSNVKEHIELAYLFSTVVSVARMQHLPTFKEKVKQHPEDVTMALLNYPVLMAADILVYKAGLVPVGIDQEPHLEIAREIARKMNEKYGLDFPEPQRFATPGQYVPSLTGEGKMSKSVEGSYINLTDNLDEIRAKLAKAPTDEGKGKEVPKEGGVAALLTFVELFQGSEKRAEYEKKYVVSGIEYRVLKQELAEAIYDEISPIQERRRELEANSKLVDDVISDGAARASKVASETLAEVKKAMGLF